MKNKLSVLQFMAILHAFSYGRQVIVWIERDRNTRQGLLETASEVINEFCSHNDITLSGEEFDELREAVLRVAKVTDLGLDDEA